MGELFDGWSWWVEDAFLVHSPDEPEPWFKPWYITKTEDDEPKLTTEQEIDLMNEQINVSKGFDIDYKLFRCLFNYHPVVLDDYQFVEPPETNVDLLNRLCEKSIDDYNQENKTEFEFVKPLYANFHMSSGIMFLITFEVKDPVDNLAKQFQARVRYSFLDKTEFVFCRPRPTKEVSTDEDSVGKGGSINEDSVGVAEENAMKNL
ncbi:unnamed protein product [Microthlaspi erraticum]|uniref:Cystatin domain-containing protein n=1 Tax=Microthlaspi erraticum TaxID=1685480 RepID=A0A6D2I451_9BRAS|nr:unnamed protein product [Microthlaspi erraticum]